MKNKSQLNRKMEAITLQTLVVGIDIAKERQRAEFVNCRGMECGQGMAFTNDRTGFEALLAKIREISKGKVFRGCCSWDGTDRALLESLGKLPDEAGQYPCRSSQSLPHEKDKGTGR